MSEDYNQLTALYLGRVNILLSEKVLRPTPERAMPQKKRNKQKRGNEVEKAAHVPETAIRM